MAEFEFFTNGNTTVTAMTGVVFLAVDCFDGSNNSQWTTVTFFGDFPPDGYVGEPHADNRESRPDKRRDDNLREIFG